LEELNLSFEKENFELQFRRLSEKIPDVSIKEKFRSAWNTILLDFYLT
jgi:hypothetical protein